MTEKLAALRGVLGSLDGAAIAVSGGVDSMTLATVAGRLAGHDFEIFHALSPAVPADATARVRR
ncbi:MAG TPA: adenine nucleotide alpha hydrolase, partial [Alphaproteobacteria bacterium]|nr:adenine nucleotide alpha hydrolase [Alphaproteobacteria bacterium]